MSKNQVYICFEGVEGVGKTTQAARVSERLRSEGFSVLTTGEPGTKNVPLTMQLRNLMLNKEFDEQMSMTAREYISQAARSIHIEKLIKPALAEGKYHFIIQDRGLLSGLAYGEACGNSEETLLWLMNHTRGNCQKYDLVVIFKGDVKACLDKAQTSKQEFVKGDVIEEKGVTFMKRVEENLYKYKEHVTDNVALIDITGKTIEQVTDEVLNLFPLD